jgi:hypothetical protein
MRLIGLAAFDSFDPVRQRFEVHVEGTKNGGMTSQTHFDRACPLLKLGQKGRFESLIPLIDVSLQLIDTSRKALLHGLQVLFELFVQLNSLTLPTDTFSLH